MLRAWGLRVAEHCAIVAVALKLRETDFKIGFGTKVAEPLGLKPYTDCRTGKGGQLFAKPWRLFESAAVPRANTSHREEGVRSSAAHDSG
jgi:hypothetical protein